MSREKRRRVPQFRTVWIDHRAWQRTRLPEKKLLHFFQSRSEDRRPANRQGSRGRVQPLPRRPIQAHANSYRNRLGKPLRARPATAAMRAVRWNLIRYARVCVVAMIVMVMAVVMMMVVIVHGVVCAAFGLESCVDFL